MNSKGEAHGYGTATRTAEDANGEYITTFTGTWRQKFTDQE